MAKLSLVHTVYTETHCWSMRDCFAALFMKLRARVLSTHTHTHIQSVCVAVCACAAVCVLLRRRGEIV